MKLPTAQITLAVTKMICYTVGMLKDVIGYEGIYRVSSTGTITPVTPRNKYRTVLNPSTDGSGYQIVSLVKNGVKHTKTVHRIVAEAFYGQSNLDVNHKNGNKADNRLSNLEFCTKSENSKHAIKTGLFKPNFKRIAVDKRKQVEQLTTSDDLVATYQSAHEASRLTGYNRGNISTSCRLGKIMYGYKWRYINASTN